MTLKEADEAAVATVPVIYQGIEYQRITEVGYRYAREPDAGVFGIYVEVTVKRPFLQLLDKSNCVVYADPARVSLKN